MPRQTKIKYSQSKEIERTTVGSCPYCHKNVKALEAHVRDKHRKQKLIKRR